MKTAIALLGLAMIVLAPTTTALASNAAILYPGLPCLELGDVISVSAHALPDEGVVYSMDSVPTTSVAVVIAPRCPIPPIPQPIDPDSCTGVYQRSLAGRAVAYESAQYQGTGPQQQSTTGAASVEAAAANAWLNEAPNGVFGATDNLQDATLDNAEAYAAATAAWSVGYADASVDNSVALAGGATQDTLAFKSCVA